MAAATSKPRKPVRLKSLPKRLLWVCQGGPLDNVRVSSRYEGDVAPRVGNKAAHGTGAPPEQIPMIDHGGVYLLRWREDGKHEYVWRNYAELAMGPPLAAPDVPEPRGQRDRRGGARDAAVAAVLRRRVRRPGL